MKSIMKLKVLLLLLILACLSISSTYKSPDIMGTIAIKASKYDNTNLPSIPYWVDTFDIKIYKMRHSNLLDDLIEYKESYSIDNGAYYFAPDTGRYVVSITQGALSNKLDFNYQGGNISFTLILQ